MSSMAAPNAFSSLLFRDANMTISGSNITFSSLLFRGGDTIYAATG